MSTPQTLPSAQRARPRALAIVPAAGASRRMGQAKLLLPWRGRPLIESTLRGWQASSVDAVIAVVLPDDTALIAHVRALGVEVVVPHAPPAEMKDSVRIGLQYARENFAPHDDDTWLLAPADMPELSPAVVDQLLAEYAARPQPILVAQHAGRRGHPALFSWKLAAEVEALSEHEGVNALFARHPVQAVECGAAALAADIDTPDDLQRLRDR